MTVAMAIATMVAIGATAWLWSFRDARAVPVPTVEICSTPPEAAAAADDTGTVDVSLEVAVPMETPSTTAALLKAVPARRGDIVRVVIRSPRDGSVAVHGLLDTRKIRAREPLTIVFRTIYTGRFPVHFHAPDGSHFEVAAVRVASAR